MQGFRRTRVRMSTACSRFLVIHRWLSHHFTAVTSESQTWQLLQSSANIAGPQHVEDLIRAHQTRSHNSLTSTATDPSRYVHQSDGLCLSWRQRQQPWHITHSYIWKHKQWRNAPVMPRRLPLHLWSRVGCLNRADNGLIYFDVQQVDGYVLSFQNTRLEACVKSVAQIFDSIL